MAAGENVVSAETFERRSSMTADEQKAFNQQGFKLFVCFKGVWNIFLGDKELWNQRKNSMLLTMDMKKIEQSDHRKSNADMAGWEKSLRFFRHNFPGFWKSRRISLLLYFVSKTANEKWSIFH